MKPSYLSLLRKLYTSLSGTPIRWAVTGSAAFALQGLPFEPEDVDIQTDREGAYAIEAIFKEYVRRPVAYSSNGAIRSYFGELSVDGIKVEIMGDIEKCVDGHWEQTPDLSIIRRFVRVEEMELPVLALAYEAEAYRKLGRTGKAELILQYVDN